MKYKLIFLDGYHVGAVIDSMDAPPTWKMSKMRAPVIDAIDAAEITPSEIEYEEYKRTFISEDRRTILYSTTGDSFDSITKGRDWVVTSDKFYIKKSPMYFGKSEVDNRKNN